MKQFIQFISNETKMQHGKHIKLLFFHDNIEKTKYHAQTAACKIEKYSNFLLIIKVLLSLSKFCN